VVRIGTFVTAPYRASGTGLEAGGLFLGYLFGELGVRRVEGLLADDVLAQVSSGLGRLFTRDATLRDAAFIAGRFRDVHIVSLSRQEWQRRIQLFMALSGGEAVR
jgi:RimJ/RimL family protein N-acetyltransferase